MKFIQHILGPGILICSLLMAGCKKEEILEEPSHRVIFTSEMDFQNRIEVGGSITFGDISPGVVSREWTLPAGAADIVNADNDQSSTEATIEAVFSEAGTYDIKLSQTFEKEAFVGTEVVGTNLDTTIVVTVLDSIEIEVQAFWINKDGTTGAEIVLEDGAENAVPASGSVRYTFSSVGEPQQYQWNFEGGDPNQVSDFQAEIDVKYKRLGTYDMSFRAFRGRPFGQDSVAFDNLIKVIPSTDPVTLDQVTERKGNIALVFSREMEPSSLDPADFAVTIKTDWETMMPMVESASLDPDEGNVVLLTLAGEQIYNDDSVKISYTPGELKTADGIKADAFTDAILIFEITNLLVNSNYDYSFENSLEENWTYLEWGDPWDQYQWTLTDAQSYDGSRSALVDMNPAGGMIIGLKDENGDDVTFPVKADQAYELGLWVYAEDLGQLDGLLLEPDLRMYWNPDTDWSIGGNPVFSTSFPMGEWVYSSAFVKFAQTGQASFMIRGFNSTNPENLKVYIDNITLAEVTLRP